MVSIYNVHNNRYYIMRKVIQGVIFIAFFLSLALLITGFIGKMLRVKAISEKIETLPEFSFSTLSMDDFHSSEIKEGPVLIVRFHPECEHCQYEISQILKSDIPVLVSRVLLISSDNPDSIRRFLIQFDYASCHSIIPLSDTSDSFGTIFGKDIVPSNYIYNKELKLVKVIFGETKTETIRKYIMISE
jgi:hypothetical protein